MKKFFLSSLLILLSTTSLFAIKLLHPGVTVNSIRLSSTMYLLSETEMASFTAWKINNDFLNRELVRKETTIKIYKDFNKELMTRFSAISSKFMQASELAEKQLKGRLSDRKHAKNARRRASIFGLLRGALYTTIYFGLKGL